MLNDVKELTLGTYYKVAEDQAPDGGYDLIVRDTRTNNVDYVRIETLESYNQFIKLLEEGSIVKVDNFIMRLANS
jgi:hypothetical protein